MNKRISLQRALLLTTALPTALVVAYSAQARDVAVAAPVAPATSVEGADVNAAIVAAITAPDDANLKVTLASGAVVSGDTVVLNPGVGQGDGRIEFANSGRVGSVDAATGAVTESVGVQFNGRAAAGSTNTFTGANNGLVTGGLRAVGFGGNVTITNAGDIHNAIIATGNGDISVATAATGAVRSGAVQAVSNNVSTAAAPVGGMTTTSVGGGSATVAQAGDVADADDTVRGNIVASGLDGADITLSAKAGTVTANAGGVVETVAGSNAVTSGTVTTTTTRGDTTRGGGSAAVTIQEEGDALAVNAVGVGGATATIDGHVEGQVTAFSSAASTTSTGVSTVDGAAVVSGSTKTTSAAAGQVAGVTVGQTGTVGGPVTVNGQGGADVVVDGDVKGNVTLTSQAIDRIDQNAFAAGKTSSSSTLTGSGGAASASVGAGGNIAGSLTATADAGVEIANAGTIEGNVTGTSRRSLSSGKDETNNRLTSSATLVETTNEVSSETRNEAVGGAVSFANATGAQARGNVSLTGIGDVTVENSGVVFGQTDATSSGRNAQTSDVQRTSVSTTIATPPALDSTTTSNERVIETATTAVGGNVTGTYAGANGTLNFVVSDGSIRQQADKASHADVTGVVYGSLTSQAGSRDNVSSNNFASSETLSGGNGTETVETSWASADTTNAGGDSVVTVSGLVAAGNFGVNPFVESRATGDSRVTIAGGVEGNVTSIASSYDEQRSDSSLTKQTITGGVYRTDSSVNTGSYSYQAAGGAASVDLTGTGKAATRSGEVRAEGLTNARVTVAAGASVGGADNGFANVVARADGYDYDQTVERSFVRDVAAGTGTATETITVVLGTSALVGDATVAIAGKVTGEARAESTRGDATASISGTVGRNVTATAANGYLAEHSDTSEYAGAIAAASTSPAIVKRTVSDKETQVGGTASVVVDTAAALKNLDQYGVLGDVNAIGLVGASITVANGSKVRGDLTANSSFADSSRERTELYNVAGALTEENVSESATQVGGAASITVGTGSRVDGSANADGDASASVANAGSIGGDVVARSIGSNRTAITKGTNLNQPALQAEDMVETFTGVGGSAEVRNAAGAIVGGSVRIAGAEGSVVNNGGIAGNIEVGSATQNYALHTVKTLTTTTQNVLEDGPALFDQSYTVDQNNFLGGGIVVTGAVIGDPFGRAGEPPVPVSNIDATINLNNGSITLGDIVADRDAQGNRLTNTTLNLNGAGFLGAEMLPPGVTGDPDYSPPDYLPEVLLPQEARDLGFGGRGVPTGTAGAVRILGVETVNKEGSGTFVLDLAPYGVPFEPKWSADVGEINVKAGELQLSGPAYDPANPDGPFVGIRGDINVNGGTLLLGRRFIDFGDRLGQNITGQGANRVQGIRLFLDGDFNQTAGGTTSIVVDPSLVRLGPVSIGTNNGGSEVLGPISAGANVPYFTTPGNSGLQAPSASRIDVTGTVNLAGNIVVDVTRDGIYADGDGYTLFTYGKAANLASVNLTQSIASPFVRFGLADDGKGAIRVVARRASYASVATNPNAGTAAGALDALIPVVIGKIRDDANGGAVFSTVSEIGLVQDAANIMSGLDWRLSQAGAEQVFNELSSAEFYGSLAAIEQNSALVESFESAAATATEIGGGVGLWINPVGRFARYGGGHSGASKIRDNSYGAAFGLQLGYSDTGSIGMGFAYAEHDIAARGTPEEAKAKTYSLGVDWRQSFGEGAFHVGGQFIYGFSDFDVTRHLTLLDRTTEASFKGRQWDASLEVGYNVMKGTDTLVLPYGKLALRHWTLGGFTEEGGAGIGVSADRASKTVFVPEVGVRLATTLAATSDLTVRPFGKVSYTFQGDVGSSRSFTYAAGGAPFTLAGVDPKGFGSVDGGISAIFNDHIGIFAQGGLNFGGSQKGAEVRGGVNLRF